VLTKLFTTGCLLKNHNEWHPWTWFIYRNLLKCLQMLNLIYSIINRMPWLLKEPRKSGKKMWNQSTRDSPYHKEL
jgi:hypothetical protein